MEHNSSHRRTKKKQIVWVTVLLFACGCAATEQNENPTSISATPFGIAGWTPRNLHEVLSDTTARAPTRVSATLYVPESATPTKPVPAIVLLHDSSGDWAGIGARQGKQFAKHGVAALVVDTFGSRGLRADESYLSRLRKVSGASQLADAYSALAALSGHALIDPQRIAVAGFSMGGRTAYLAANKRIADVLAPQGSRFVAHLAYYAPCDFRFESQQTTGAPILLMLGERDESTPIQRCEQMAHDLRAAGSEVTIITYETAAHAWLLRQPKQFIELINPGPCQWVVAEDGTAFEKTTGKSAMDAASLLDVLLECGSTGFTVGRDEEATRRSIKDALEFMNAAELL